MPGVCISCLGCASHLLRLLQVAQVIDGCSQRIKHTACMPCHTHNAPVNMHAAIVASPGAPTYHARRGR